MGIRFPTAKDGFERCVDALGAEIEVAQKGGRSSRSYRAIDGKRLGAYENGFLYEFRVSKVLPQSLEDAPVRIMVGGQSIGGTVVALQEYVVSIATEADLGAYIAQVEIELDLTFILKSLRERLEAIGANGRLPPMSSYALALDEPGKGSVEPSIGYGSLNKEQQEALRQCLGSTVCFVWGPPGTGKTTTLGYLLAELLLNEVPTLLVSNTNVAVDRALTKLLDLAFQEGLKRDELTDRFEAGKVVRVGRTKETQDRFALDKIVERANKDTLIEIDRVSKELQERRARATSLGSRAVSVRQLARIVSEIGGMNQNIANARAQLQFAKGHLSSNEQLLKVVRNKIREIEGKTGLGRLVSGFKLSRLRSEETSCVSRVASYRNDSATVQGELSRAMDRLRAAQAEQQALLSTFPGLSDTSEEEIETQLAAIGGEIAILEAQLQNLNDRLISVREQAISNAIIVASTCAKSHLDDAIASRGTRVVVIDESSMVSIPQIAWLSTLATDAMCVFGDPFQLPPISALKEEEDEAAQEVMTSSIFDIHGVSNGTKSNVGYVLLRDQHRMPSAICELVNTPIYGGRLRTVRFKEAEAGNQSISLISTARYNAWSAVTNRWSHYNWHHAFVAIKLFERILDEAPISEVIDPLGIEPIAYIAPYVAQCDLVRAVWTQYCRDSGRDAWVPLVRIATVHGFQGEERQVVIYDTVDSHPFPIPGRFLREADTNSTPLPVGARLANVAATRAQNQLVVVAHERYLSSSLGPNNLVRQIIEKAGAIRLEHSDELVIGVDITAFVPSAPVLPMEGCTIVGEDDFVAMFQRDLSNLADAGELGELLLFSPFLSVKGIADWSDTIRCCLERKVEVTIITRKPGRQQSLFGDDVESLVEQLRSLGVSVVFDAFVKGMKPIHYKVAILRGLAGGPIVWLGSMNVLSHHGSHELMQRIVGSEIHDRVVELLRADVLVGQGRSKVLAKQVGDALRTFLENSCPKHRLPRVLKRSTGQKRGYFLSCPQWKDGCPTVNVRVDDLNRAFAMASSTCPKCGEALSAGYGKYGVYVRCENMHYTDLPAE